jgi:hypothetical protein
VYRLTGGLGTEAGSSNAGERVSERYVDAEGFVRKGRNNLGILLWLGVAAANVAMRHAPSDFDILVLVSWPISAYLLLVAIQMGSSHDIETWKGTSHVKLWIFLGNIIAGLLGLIVYDLLKRREKSYLKKANRPA